VGQQRSVLKIASGMCFKVQLLPPALTNKSHWGFSMAQLSET